MRENRRYSYLIELPSNFFGCWILFSKCRFEKSPMWIQFNIESWCWISTDEEKTESSDGFHYCYTCCFVKNNCNMKSQFTVVLYTIRLFFVLSAFYQDKKKLLVCIYYKWAFFIMMRQIMPYSYLLSSL